MRDRVERIIFDRLFQAHRCHLELCGCLLPCMFLWLSLSYSLTPVKNMTVICLSLLSLGTDASAEIVQGKHEAFHISNASGQSICLLG